jgi:Exonuclease III
MPALTSDSPRAQLTRSVLNTIKEKMPILLLFKKQNYVLLVQRRSTKKFLQRYSLTMTMSGVLLKSRQEKAMPGRCFYIKNTLTPEVTKPAIGAPDTMDYEGRILTLEFDNYYVTQVYTPNSGNELKRLEDRQIWDEKYTEYLQKLDKSKPVIASGDYNVAHTPIDLKHPKITTITLALLMKSVKALINY